LKKITIEISDEDVEELGEIVEEIRGLPMLLEQLTKALGELNDTLSILERSKK